MSNSNPYLNTSDSADNSFPNQGRHQNRPYPSQNGRDRFQYNNNNYHHNAQQPDDRGSYQRRNNNYNQDRSNKYQYNNTTNGDMNTNTTSNFHNNHNNNHHQQGASDAGINPSGRFRHRSYQNESGDQQSSVNRSQYLSTSVDDNSGSSFRPHHKNNHYHHNNNNNNAYHNNNYQHHQRSDTNHHHNHHDGQTRHYHQQPQQQQPKQQQPKQQAPVSQPRFIEPTRFIPASAPIGAAPSTVSSNRTGLLSLFNSFAQLRQHSLQIVAEHSSMETTAAAATTSPSSVTPVAQLSDVIGFGTFSEVFSARISQPLPDSTNTTAAAAASMNQSFSAEELVAPTSLCFATPRRHFESYFDLVLNRLGHNNAPQQQHKLALMHEFRPIRANVPKNQTFHQYQQQFASSQRHTMLLSSTLPANLYIAIKSERPSTSNKTPAPSTATATAAASATTAQYITSDNNLVSFCEELNQIADSSTVFEETKIIQNAAPSGRVPLIYGTSHDLSWLFPQLINDAGAFYPSSSYCPVPPSLHNNTPFPFIAMQLAGISVVNARRCNFDLLSPYAAIRIHVGERSQHGFLSMHRALRPSVLRQLISTSQHIDPSQRQMNLEAADRASEQIRQAQSVNPLSKDAQQQVISLVSSLILYSHCIDDFKAWLQSQFKAEISRINRCFVKAHGGDAATNADSNELRMSSSYNNNNSANSHYFTPLQPNPHDASDVCHLDVHQLKSVAQCHHSMILFLLRQYIQFINVYTLMSYCLHHDQQLYFRFQHQQQQQQQQQNRTSSTTTTSSSTTSSSTTLKPHAPPTISPRTQFLLHQAYILIMQIYSDEFKTFHPIETMFLSAVCAATVNSGLGTPTFPLPSCAFGEFGLAPVNEVLLKNIPNTSLFHYFVPRTLHGYMNLYIASQRRKFNIFSRFPLHYAASLAHGMLESITAVHQCGIIHKDIKLGNFSFPLANYFRRQDVITPNSDPSSQMNNTTPSTSPPVPYTTYSTSHTDAPYLLLLDFGTSIQYATPHTTTTESTAEPSKSLPDQQQLFSINASLLSAMSREKLPQAMLLSRLTRVTPSSHPFPSLQSHAYFPLPAQRQHRGGSSRGTPNYASPRVGHFPSSFVISPTPLYYTTSTEPQTAPLSSIDESNQSTTTAAPASAETTPAWTQHSMLVPLFQQYFAQHHNTIITQFNSMMPQPHALLTQYCPSLLASMTQQFSALVPDSKFASYIAPELFSTLAASVRCTYFQIVYDTLHLVLGYQLAQTPAADPESITATLTNVKSIIDSVAPPPSVVESPVLSYCDDLWAMLFSLLDMVWGYTPWKLIALQQSQSTSSSTSASASSSSSSSSIFHHNKPIGCYLAQHTTLTPEQTAHVNITEVSSPILHNNVTVLSEQSDALVFESMRPARSIQTTEQLATRAFSRLGAQRNIRALLYPVIDPQYIDLSDQIGDESGAGGNISTTATSSQSSTSSNTPQITPSTITPPRASSSASVTPVGQTDSAASPHSTASTTPIPTASSGVGGSTATAAAATAAAAAALKLSKLEQQFMSPLFPADKLQQCLEWNVRSQAYSSHHADASKAMVVNDLYAYVMFIRRSAVSCKSFVDQVNKINQYTFGQPQQQSQPPTTNHVNSNPAATQPAAAAPTRPATPLPPLYNIPPPSAWTLSVTHNTSSLIAELGILPHAMPDPILSILTALIHFDHVFPFMARIQRQMTYQLSKNQPTGLQLVVFTALHESIQSHLRYIYLFIQQQLFDLINTAPPLLHYSPTFAPGSQHNSNNVFYSNLCAQGQPNASCELQSMQQACLRRLAPPAAYVFGQWTAPACLPPNNATSTYMQEIAKHNAKYGALPTAVNTEAVSDEQQYESILDLFTISTPYLGLSTFHDQ